MHAGLQGVAGHTPQVPHQVLQSPEITQDPLECTSLDSSSSSIPIKHSHVLKQRRCYYNACPSQNIAFSIPEVLKSRRNSVVMNIHLEDLMGDTDLTDYLKDYKITQEMFELPRPKW